MALPRHPRSYGRPEFIARPVFFDEDPIPIRSDCGCVVAWPWGVSFSTRRGRGQRGSTEESGRKSRRAKNHHCPYKSTPAEPRCPSKDLVRVKEPFGHCCIRGREPWPWARRRANILEGAIGNVLEWYDFAIYGYFAGHRPHLFEVSARRRRRGNRLVRSATSCSSARQPTLMVEEVPAAVRCTVDRDRLQRDPGRDRRPQPAGRDLAGRAHRRPVRARRHGDGGRGCVVPVGADVPRGPRPARGRDVACALVRFPPHSNGEVAPSYGDGGVMSPPMLP